MLILELPLEWPRPIAISCEFGMAVADVDCRWTLQGIVYFGSNHYTSRFIDDDDSVWYHDGADTGSHCLHNGDSITDLIDINTVHNRRAYIVIYRHADT